MESPRIVSLLASGTEILYAIGAGDNVVGVSHECDFPPEIAGKPRLTRANVDASRSSGDIDRQVKEMARDGRAMYAIDVEKLAELRPDLIVTQSHCEVCAVSFRDVERAVGECEALDRTRIVTINPSNLEAVFDDIRRVALAASCESGADSLIRILDGRIDRVQSKTLQIHNGDRPRVACIEWIDPVMLAANWIPELIEAAGGRSPIADAGEASTYTDWADVVAFDPQVIVVAACGFDRHRTVEEMGALAKRPHWQELSAVRNDRVFAADGNAYFNRSGPRLVDTLEIFSQAIHPELFRRTFEEDVWGSVSQQL